MQHDIELAFLRELYGTYPPILQIKAVAEILQEAVPTIRAQIRRGSFPIAVRQEPGGRQYVLLTDLVRFISTGEYQAQPTIRISRSSKNINISNESRRPGRPTKAEQMRKTGDL